MANCSGDKMSAHAGKRPIEEGQKETGRKCPPLARNESTNEAPGYSGSRARPPAVDGVAGTSSRKRRWRLRGDAERREEAAISTLWQSVPKLAELCGAVSPVTRGPALSSKGQYGPA